jgi:hypothetical protein
VFGTKPITFDGAFIGLQASGSAVMAKTSAPVTFGGANALTVEPGQICVIGGLNLPATAPCRD